MEEYEKEIMIMKALTHPTRLAILDILRNGEQCVCHMEAILGLRQAYISQQLMVLREAGLVEDRRDGWNMYYRVIRPEIYNVLDTTRQLVDAPKAKVASSTVCNCPNCKDKAEHKLKAPLEIVSG
jgi:DNA-binding transcriptional ArsR family regulator